MRNRLIRQTAGASRADRLRYAGALVVVSVLLSGCGGGSLFGGSSTPTPTPVIEDTPTITDRPMST